MFKPHTNICIECGQETMVVVKKMLCAKCNHNQKQAKKKAAGKKTGGYKYIREATGEKDTFHAVLDNLPDTETVCFVCGVRIAVVTVHNFSHILPKGKYPLYRNNPENIRLLCHRFVADKDGFQGCHYSSDMRPRSEIINDPNWQKFFELEAVLKEEYKQLENNQP